MSAGHTPGQWAVEEPLPGELWVVKDGKQSFEWFPLASCMFPDADEPFVTVSEVKANARLIAAAPELLEACEGMIPKNVCLTNTRWPDDTNVPLDVSLGDLRKLAALVAKARGQ